MKFGAVPVAEATGATLAHSVRAAGRRMRKGAVLTAQDILALQGEGLSEVIVARLDAGDLDENAAAARLAEALVPDPAAAHLDRTEAFTGRVNLLARGPGVTRLDVAAIEAANRVDPMITVATVPPWQQVGPGQMVATIKIISYAVPAAALERACEIARGALSLCPPRLATAELIVTQIPGGPPDDKGIASVRARVEALAMALSDVRLVPHRRTPLAEALRDSHADLVLVLTASATSDPDDVAPGALRDAGGRVDRFGMPVDPGNLLFLGALGARPVIGLPGCARTPALNGADWVLSRVACGVPVTPDDIAAMGVGGLLKEIPTRPHPRRTRARDD